MTVTAMPKTSTPEDTGDAPVRRSRKKLIVILVAVLAFGGGGYWFLRPQPASAPMPGEVVTLEPIQINLAAGHYLRMGLALQLVAGAHEADGSKALDAAIQEFSGVAMAEVNDPARRTVLKERLEKELDHRYHGEVMGVYFTEFVTQ